MSSPSSFRSSSFDPSDGSAKMFPSMHMSHIPTAFIDPEEQPEIQRLPLPISTEYDMIRDNYFSKEKVDRSHWVSQLLESHPEIKELRERVLPLDRAIEFGRLYLPDERLISHNVLLSLISQHLRTLGLVESQSSLHSEWDGPFEVPSSFNRSQLTFLIQRGVLHAERFWELTMPGTMPADADQKLLEEISRIIGGSPIIHDCGKSLEEEKNEQPNVVDGVLKSATVNQLIWICTTDSPFLKDDLMTAFCLTFSSYCDASVFFTKLKERFSIAFRETPHEKMAKSVELTFHLLTSWIKENGNEFEGNIMSSIKSFIDAEIKPKFPKLCDLMQEAPKQIVEDPIDYTRAPKVEISGPPHSLWTGQFNIMSLPPKEFARQMTIHFSRYFFNVKRSEFLGQAWETPQLMHRAPNLVHIIENGERFVFWACSVILGPLQPNQTRTDLATYFYKLAKKLYDMQNYLNCTTVLSIFDQVPIYRLKNTLGHVDGKLTKWAQGLHDIILNYDQNMKAPTDLSEKGRSTLKPVLPVLTAYLKILGNFTASTSSKRGIVDVSVITQIYQHIRKIEDFQKKKFCFLPIDQAQEFFDNIPTIDKTELDMISKVIEPPQSESRHSE